MSDSPSGGDSTQRNAQIAPQYETEDQKAARFEEERQQKLAQFKKENMEKEKKMKKMREKLKQKQIEKTKRKLANNPLTVDQVSVYEQNLRRVTGKSVAPVTKSAGSAGSTGSVSRTGKGKI
ncbi:hypothetical protein TRFO_06836 [Tritrichomonas foetus]|uniref:Uncharacterized protein n=1 Tax=Tritrichomonas foetus TaxID=1144522 RepID=A0A1J4JVK1_9EUKA|nr:hypothetical protein TRFO_06836 [Tritrichomonas foetus]|eukprot:OHT03161.1 hypothetical protein TRFO_06836 [Tritrichomonas foetus]